MGWERLAQLYRTNEQFRQLVIDSLESQKRRSVEPQTHVQPYKDVFLETKYGTVDLYEESQLKHAMPSGKRPRYMKSVPVLKVPEWVDTDSGIGGLVHSERFVFRAAGQGSSPEQATLVVREGVRVLPPPTQASAFDGHADAMTKQLIQDLHKDTNMDDTFSLKNFSSLRTMEEFIA